MNAHTVGHFHLFTLKGNRCLELDLDNPSLVPYRTKFYDRMLAFDDLKIYIERGIEITEQTLHTDSSNTGGGAGQSYLIKDIDLVKTRDGKIALVSVSTEYEDNLSVFIGSTLDTEYFNATICGEIEDGQDANDDNAVFSELNNGYETTTVYSKQAVVKTHLNNPEKSPTAAKYHMVVAITRHDTIIRNGLRCDDEAAYFYTHNADGNFVAAWVDRTGDVLYDNLKYCIEKSHTYQLGGEAVAAAFTDDDEAAKGLVGKLLDDPYIWKPL